MAAWRFIKFTLCLEPKFYKPVSDLTADCNVHSTIFNGLHLRSSILEVKKILETDPDMDVFNDQNILELFNLLFKFIPEMKHLVHVYCRHDCYERLESKATEKNVNEKSPLRSYVNVQNMPSCKPLLL